MKHSSPPVSIYTVHTLCTIYVCAHNKRTHVYDFWPLYISRGFVGVVDFSWSLSKGVSQSRKVFVPKLNPKLENFPASVPRDLERKWENSSGTKLVESSLTIVRSFNFLKHNQNTHINSETEIYALRNLTATQGPNIIFDII